MSKGFIFGNLEKFADNIKDKFAQSAFFGFLQGDCAANEAARSSVILNASGYIKDKLFRRNKKSAPKTLAGRKQLKRAEERVGVADAADLPKSLGYVWGGAVLNSRIMIIINRFWQMLCKTQASLIGALLLLISISSFAMSLIKHIVKTATSTDSFSLCLSLVMFVIAILLIGTGNKSVYELFTQSLVGSQFVNSAMGIRTLDEEKNDVYQKETSSSPKTFAVILFCLLICGISLWAGLERIVLISLVSCFVIAVLKMPESGIMMLLVVFPWVGLFENDELILAAISLLILFSWMFKLSIGKRVYSFCFVDIAVLAFLAVFLLFGIYSVSTKGNLNEVWSYFFVGLLYFPITGLVRSSEWMSRCMRAYTLGTLIVSFVGIAQFAVMCLTQGYRGFFGVTSVFENNLTLCAYLLVGIYIGLFNFLERYEHERNLSYDVSLALNIICFVLAGSKTAYLALLVSFLLFLLIRKPKVLALLLLLTPLVVVVIAMMPETVSEGLSNVIESSDVGIRSKLQLWSNILENTKDYLFFGIGTHPSALEAVWDDCTDYLQSPAQMYNLYLSISVKMGVVGIVIFGAMAVSTIQRGFYVFFGDQSGSYFKNLSVCTMSSFVSLMVFGMGDSILYDINLFLLIFFAVAVVRCTKFVYLRETKTIEQAEDLDIDISVKRRRQDEKDALAEIIAFAVKCIKKIRKIIKAVSAKRKAFAQVNEDGVEDNQHQNEEEELLIEEVELSEEESAWQRK